MDVLQGESVYWEIGCKLDRERRILGYYVELIIIYLLVERPAPMVPIFLDEHVFEKTAM